MKQLSRAWRLFGTALSFTVFGIAGCILSWLIFPIVFLFWRDAAARQVVARRIIGAAFRAFVWLMKTVGVLSYNIIGKENIVLRTNQLVIANHPTLIDVVFLISMFPQAECVVKPAVTRNPFMRSTVTAANYISSNQFEILLDTCVERLQSGASLLLFPEGTRTVPGQPIDFTLGAAEIAIRAGSDILPVTFECVPSVLSKQVPWYRIPPDRPHITIHVRPPIALNQLIPSVQHDRQTRRELNEAFVSLIVEGIS